CFETFPFPQGPLPEVAEAACRLDGLRQAWTIPAEWVEVVAEVLPQYPDRLLPRDADCAARLRKRTLTALYNAMPNWLAEAHADLDAAVARAYGWQAGIGDDEALRHLLEMNLSVTGK
ncbi:MAG: class I SAM-dependent DNA methyltransferase, partial [Rhodospirillales bacterium]|nr:class I SAM-dependent DNA methyltransferase [Rhodospirillales bacterium]